MDYVPREPYMKRGLCSEFTDTSGKIIYLVTGVSFLDSESLIIQSPKCLDSHGSTSALYN